MRKVRIFAKKPVIAQFIAVVAIRDRVFRLSQFITRTRRPREHNHLSGMLIKWVVSEVCVGLMYQKKWCWCGFHTQRTVPATDRAVSATNTDRAISAIDRAVSAIDRAVSAIDRAVSPETDRAVAETDCAVAETDRAVACLCASRRRYSSSSSKSSFCVANTFMHRTFRIALSSFWKVLRSLSPHDVDHSGSTDDSQILVESACFRA